MLTLALKCGVGWCGYESGGHAKMAQTSRLPVGPRWRQTSYWLSAPQLHARVLASRVLVPPPLSTHRRTPLPVPNFRSPTILLMGIPGSSRSQRAIPTCLSTTMRSPLILLFYSSFLSYSHRILILFLTGIYVSALPLGLTSSDTDFKLHVYLFIGSFSYF